MVNIRKFIGQIKGDAVSDAKGLAAARKERLKLEGRVKLQKAAASERSRIAKAKKDLRANSKFGRITSSIGTGLKQLKKESKAYKKERDPNNPWRN